MASNGVVHVINEVLLPPSLLASSAPTRSIVELAIATPALSTLVSVLTSPGFEGVLDALSGDGPFTVFAPTNEAFARAGVDGLDTATIIEVLKYHVVAGAAVPSSALSASQSVGTFQGENL